MAETRSIEAARRAGTVPSAPGFSGWWVATGGFLGALGGGLAVPWLGWAEQAWAGDTGMLNFAALRGPLLAALAAPALGAVAGLVVAQVLLGATGAWGLRRKARSLPPPRRWGWVAVVGAALAGLALPAALAGDGDAGGLLLRAPIVGAALAALGTLPAALLDRARARAAYAALTDPENAPRARAPATRRALSAPEPPASDPGPGP